MAFSASASVPCPVKLLAGRGAGRVRLRRRCSHTDGLRDASGTPTRGTYAREAEREAELAAAAATQLRSALGGCARVRHRRPTTGHG